MPQSIPEPDSGVDFDAFVRKHTDALKQFFRRRIFEQSEVDDLVQEVFMRLARHGLEDVSHYEGYLFKTATNVLHDRNRNRTSRHLDDQTMLQEDYVSDADFSPERVLMGKEALSRVEAALQELPDRTRMVFALSRFEGWQNAEIARRFGVSVSAIEKQITKALLHISDRLERPR